MCDFKSHCQSKDSSNLLVVFGATGQQGGSVAQYVLADAELAKKYRVRAVTRDANKDAAKSLRELGAEVAEADLDDAASVQRAVEGAHTVFAVTSTVFDAEAKEREIRQGKAIADAAVAAGAQYLIYSSARSASQISNGKYPVDAPDAHAAVEQYIRTLSIRCAFVAPASFMQNWVGAGGPRPHPSGDGSFAMAGTQSSTTKIPFIDIVHDYGKFVGAVLADPDRYHGQFIAAATELLSYDEVTAKMSQVTGKTVRYMQLPEEVFRGFLPPPMKEPVVSLFRFIENCGYYGSTTGSDVAAASKVPTAPVTSADEFIKQNPPKLA